MALAEAGLNPPGGWHGQSDIQTLVDAIAARGLAAALQRSVGMFAIALWDRRERKLHLARDRIGEKPLYWGWSAKRIVFASELKAIRALPGLANPVSRAALGMPTARTYIPAPFSIYERIFNAVARRLGMSPCPEAVDYLYERYYTQKRNPRASDCRDLLEIV